MGGKVLMSSSVSACLLKTVRVKTYRLTSMHTEETIIALQKALMTPGVYRLQAPSLRQGRRHLLKLLASLAYYTNIACITSSARVPSGTNLYAQLTHAYAQAPGAYNISCFITE